MPEELKVEVLPIRRNLSIEEIGTSLEEARRCGSKVLEISESESRTIEMNTSRGTQEYLARLLATAVKKDPRSRDRFSDEELQVLQAHPDASPLPSLQEQMHALVHHEDAQNSPMHTVGGFGISSEHIKNEMR